MQFKIIFGYFGLFLGLLMILIAIVSVVRFLVLKLKLGAYLQDNRPNTWKEIGTAIGIAGIRNSHYFYSKYLESDRDNDDPKIHGMKMKIAGDLRRFCWMMIGVTADILIVLLLFMFVPGK
jgi:uncharacterized membrane protein